MRNVLLKNSLLKLKSKLKLLRQNCYGKNFMYYFILCTDVCLFVSGLIKNIKNFLFQNNFLTENNKFNFSKLNK